MRWRPIKSAPKDRLVLLACWENQEDYYVCVGRYIDCPHTNTLIEAWRAGKEVDKTRIFKGWHDGYPGIMTGNLGKSWELRSGILFRPTHWMPLPNPPVRKPRFRT